ncbi:MAG: radical SAM protein [Chloroflexi bacterium]|nr:radical SAM protein [Chloroflexota bacterium]
MDATQKLELFATQMHLEPAEESDTRSIPLNVLPSNPKPSPDVLPCGQVASGSGLPLKKDSLGVYQAAVNGRTVPILKTLLTSACERNCYYCPFRAGRNYRRATFKPEEMARTFMDMNRAGLVTGLFLSSGIIRGGVQTQDRIIATAEILRRQYNFRGYLHLKIMPGAEREQVLRTMQLADRVSINLEGANTARLQRLAPQKVFLEELLEPLRWVEEIRRGQAPRSTWNGRWPSSVTQFVVGAAGESDLELLTTSSYLYRQFRLTRTYYSAFSPVTNTPLENLPAENPWREHRLYQASFLLRDYGFDLEELPFTAEGNLPLVTDPKAAWARVHLADHPVEVNRAGREELLRVPGIGLKGAEAILAARRRARLQELSDLKAIGVQPVRPAPYVLLDGKRPEYQLPLFGELE